MATIIKRNGKWFAQVRRKGVSKSATFQTKGQASAWANQTEADIISGNYHSGSSKTFVDAIDRYLEEVTPTKRNPTNERSLLAVIRRAPFATERVTDITTEMIAQYRDSELKRIKSASVIRYIGLIGVVFEQMRREWQWVATNPVKELRKPSGSPARDRIFSQVEITALTNELIYTDIQISVRDMFLFAIETAMRAGEMINLEWDDIDFDRRTATLNKTKNNDKRIVPLSLEAVRILASRKSLPRPFSVVRQTMTSVFSAKCLSLNIENATFHDTRHTAITRLAKKLSAFELARMAGHRDMNMTLRYYNESAEEIAKKL